MRFPGLGHGHEMGSERVAYVEPLAVGDSLPAMPLFLATGMHIRVPLEQSHQIAWDASPDAMRTAVEAGVMPEPDADED